MRRNQLVIHVAWMTGRITQTPQAIDTRQSMQQLRKIPHIARGSNAAIGVHILAQKRDLSRAEFDQPSRLVQNLRGGPRKLATARIGHDTKGAKLVTTFLDGKKCAGASACALRG